MVQFASFFTYLPFLYGQEPVPRPWLAVVMTTAIALVLWDFVKAQVPGEARAPVGGRR